MKFSHDFNCFGARYYNCNLSIWLSVDPLSDMYPSTSPYMYVRGNPIMLIDPTGMNDTDWEFDRNTGKLNVVEGTQDNGPDRIIVGNAKYDDDGNLTNSKSNVHQMKGKIKNFDDNNKIEGVKYQAYALSSIEDAEGTYDFMASKTAIEIGKYEFKDASDEYRLDIRFYTSGDKGVLDKGTNYLAQEKGDNPGLILLKATHNHGNDAKNNMVGLPTPSSGDGKAGRYINDKIFPAQFPTPIHSIWRNGKERIFDPQTVPVKKE